jgi:Capsule assembly protein Wzi
MTRTFFLILGYCFGGLVFTNNLTAQNLINAQIGDLNHFITERNQVLYSDFRHIHTDIKPLLRSYASGYYRGLPKFRDEADSSNVELTILYRDEEYIIKDNGAGNSAYNSKKPLLKYFYKNPAKLFEYNSKGFSFSINPVLNLQTGMQRTARGNEFLYTNMRGVQIQGNISRKIYFYSDIYETQTIQPDYVSDFITSNNAVPGAGFYKPFTSRFTPNQNSGVDYLLATGYISFDVAKFVNIQFGNGRNFIGNGYRSLFLSNFANNYPYLKINTHYKFFQYQNIFAELVADHSYIPNTRLPKKYMTAHYLSVNILKNLNIGIFESVVFGNRGGYEFSYLNPVILYRAVEQGLGSPDNVNLGLSAKWHFLKHFSVYGQLILDEFVFNELFRNRNGWWGNKYGVQIGAKYADAFKIRDLDLQFEYNSVRPYTYSFIDSSANFTNYNQSLAHPLGSNFREFLVRANYRLNNKLFATGEIFYIQQGLNNLGENWGANPKLSYTTRVQEYGNKILQGIASKTLIFNASVQYMLVHNLFLGLHYTYRQQNAPNLQLSNTNHQLNFAIRYNFVPNANNF